MAFEASVVGEDFAGGEEQRGSAQWLILWIVREQDWGQTDSVTPELLFYGGSFFERYFEVPARGFQAADFGAHRVGQGRVPAAETYNHRFRIFSEDSGTGDS